MEALLLSTEDAAKLIGVGRTHFYGMHSSGRLGPLPVRLGKRTLWNRTELENWVNGCCVNREKWQAEKKEYFSRNNRK
jgi:excisionase family DNA binding protein